MAILVHPSVVHQYSSKPVKGLKFEWNQFNSLGSVIRGEKGPDESERRFYKLTWQFKWNTKSFMLTVGPPTKAQLLYRRS